jgi:pimeloyl-ACP methyl ester carboxylesterase
MPLFPLLAPKFRVCAMARRAHGGSGDSLPYSLQKEVDDVVAVVAVQPGPVFVVGHSFGAVLAFEAAFRTPKIARLALYEPPARAPDLNGDDVWATDDDELRETIALMYVRFSK